MSVHEVVGYGVGCRFLLWLFDRWHQVRRSWSDQVCELSVNICGVWDGSVYLDAKYDF